MYQGTDKKAVMEREGPKKKKENNRPKGNHEGKKPRDV